MTKQMIKYPVRRVLFLLFFATAFAKASIAQDKISDAVVADLNATGQSRVIVIMKKLDPQAPGSFAYANPVGYLLIVSTVTLFRQSLSLAK